MSFQLGQRSVQRLSGVHPDLVQVVRRAIEVTPIDFTVLEGVRSVERQRELVRKGASKTMNSRHLTGHAVDIAPWVNGQVSWDWKWYFSVIDAFKEAAVDVRVPVRWGGNWQVNDIRKWSGTAKSLSDAYTGTFPDGPHLELPRGVYP